MDGHVAKDPTRLTEVRPGRRRRITRNNHDLFNRAGFSGQHGLTKRMLRWIKPPIKAHHYLVDPLAKALDTAGCPSQIEIARLFTEDILAGVHRAKDKINMRIGRRTDIDCVDARKIDG